ncbi:MAG: hypothetical protein HZB76_01240 [Chlamydiae bacterium]|nr:hypothetical protein [Chlamydiota bacterium]
MSLHVDGASDSAHLSELAIRSIVYEVVDSVLIKSVVRERFFAPISPSDRIESPTFFQVSSEFVELSKAIEEASEINRFRSLSEEELFRVKHWFDQVMTKSKTSKDLVLILKIFVKWPFYNRMEFFSMVIAKLKEKNAELNNYFRSRDLILTKTAINKAIELFVKRDFFSKGLIECEDVDKLPLVIESFLRSDKKNEIRGWVACNFHAEDDHVIAVFVKKYENRIKILALDSMGHNINDLSELRAGLKNLIFYFSHRADNVEIFSFKLKRQNDGVSCSIFALSDLKNLVRLEQGGQDIFDFLVKEAHPTSVMHKIQDDSDLKFYEVDCLPPCMMKVTQSMRMIEKYKSNSPRTLSPFFLRISPFNEIKIDEEDVTRLSKAVGKSVFNSPMALVNGYVENKRLKLICMLVEDTLGDDE